MVRTGVLIGNRNNLPRICPATDRETTGTPPTRRVQEMLVTQRFRSGPAGGDAA
jgi:hypothetical protein